MKLVDFCNHLIHFRDIISIFRLRGKIFLHRFIADPVCIKCLHQLLHRIFFLIKDQLADRIKAVSGIDAANAETILANAADYDAKLQDLDARYAEVVENASLKTVLFADRFPFRYLADDYGLTYFAAFTGCSAESEASFATIAFLAGKADELNLPAVLTIEGGNHKIADTVIAASSKTDRKVLTMNSMQSVTADDVKNGMTYLSMMEENLNVLKEALN